MMKKVKSILKGAAGVAGVSLIDPIEVYYLPNENTFYPIISKSGCSSIKLMLIRRFEPDYQNAFPGIHQANPSKITGGKLERLYFRTQKAYSKWAKGKKMIFVMREPISRIYSCYLDVISNKNTMYLYPSGLDWYFKFTSDLTFEQFLMKVCSTPDYLSDRHFRSQSFYISDTVKSSLKSLEALSLKEYMSKSLDKNETGKKGSVKLNTNNSSIPEVLKEKLLQSTEFNERFKTDLLLFERIKQNAV